MLQAQQNTGVADVEVLRVEVDGVYDVGVQVLLGGMLRRDYLEIVVVVASVD